MKNMENDKNHTVELLDEWVTLKNTFVGNGICRTVYVNAKRKSASKRPSGWREIDPDAVGKPSRFPTYVFFSVTH